MSSRVSRLFSSPAFWTAVLGVLNVAVFLLYPQLDKTLWASIDALLVATIAILTGADVKASTRLTRNMSELSVPDSYNVYSLRTGSIAAIIGVSLIIALSLTVSALLALLLSAIAVLFYIIGWRRHGLA